MNRKVDIAVLGVGKMGQYHLNVLNMIDKVNLVGIFDTNDTHAKEVAKKFNTVSYSNMDELIDRVDAVIIASPTIYHFDIAKKVVGRNKHLLVEKPMTETYEQALELAELVKKHNIIFQVGHVERFNGAVQELKHVVKNPYLIEARRLSPFTPRIADVGVVFDIMIHDIDIVCSFVNKPIKHFRATGKRVRTKYEDIASAILEFEGDTIATITASRVTEEKIRTLAISSDESYCILDYATQDITLHRQAASKSNVRGGGGINYQQEALIERIVVHRDNPLKLEDEHFASCILSEVTPLVSIDNDVETLKITEGILKDIKKNW